MTASDKYRKEIMELRAKAYCSSYWISVVANSKYTKKEQKHIDQINTIMTKPENHPIWENHDFWKNKFPQIVDAAAEAVENNSQFYLNQLLEIQTARDFLEGRVISYEI